MTIKEKPIEINFVYENKEDKNNEESFDISLRHGNNIYSLQILDNYMPADNTGFKLSVKFIEEIYEFLVDKNVIINKQKVVEVIEKKTTTLNAPQIDGESAEKVPTKQFTSFANPELEKKEEKKEEVKDVPDEKPQKKKEKSTNGKTKTKSEIIIQRPVIRSRISDESDPLQAEREGAVLRGVNPEKSIKRKEA